MHALLNVSVAQQHPVTPRRWFDCGGRSGLEDRTLLMGAGGGALSAGGTHATGGMSDSGGALDTGALANRH